MIRRFTVLSVSALTSLTAFACSEPSGGATELAVAVVTTGVDLDGDGYTVVVDGDSVATVGAQGNVILPATRGAHIVTLESVQENCTVSKASQSVSVSPGNRLGVGFSVACRPHLGSAVIRTITTGVDKDPNGYLVAVGSSAPQFIDFSADLQIPNLPSGAIPVTLSGVADNCTLLSENPTTLTVPFEAMGLAQFTLNCVRNVGSLNVIIAATGEAIPPTFSIKVGTALPSPISNSGQVITDVVAGDQSVTLSVGPDCVISGSATHLVPVRFGQTSSTLFSVTCQRRLAFVSSRTGKFEIYSMLSDGSAPTQLTWMAGSNRHPEWSPDGTKIVFGNNSSGLFEIYVMNADGSGVQQITNTPGHNNVEPSWSPNGSRIVFVSDRDGSNEYYMMNPDGSGLRRVTNTPGVVGDSPRFSPDGSHLVYVKYGANGNPDIFTLDTLGGHLTQVTDDVATEYDPSFSIDGTRILYASTAAPGVDIYSIKVDGSSRIRLTTDGYYNAYPRMSPNGNTIVYVSERDGNQNLYVMNSDGSQQHAITTNPAADLTPSWKP